MFGMDILFNYFPFELQIDILKYIPCFRRLNKSFYCHGYQAFKEMYEDLPISLNEIINYKQNLCIYICLNYNFEVMIINYKNNMYYTKRCELMYNPNSISPNYYNYNIYLLDHHGIIYDEDYIKWFIYRILNNNQLFLDVETTFNILRKRNFPIEKNYNYIRPAMNDSDFDVLYYKICHLIFLLNHDIINIKLYLNKYFKFKFGKLIDRHVEYNNNIKMLDEYIEYQMLKYKND
jgi:hypothetical protein